MKKIIGLMTLGLALPAQAVDVADWALPDAEASFVFRGAARLPKVLKDLDARFGTTRTMAGVVARLQAYEVAGMHPLAGDFGPGLDPAAGIAIFASEKPADRLRFVVGIKDEALARESLVKLAKALDIPLEATPEGFKIEGKTKPPEVAPDPLAPEVAPDALAPEVAPDPLAPDLVAPTPVPPKEPKFLKCAKREQFLVCDLETPPATAPGRPTALSPDALLEMFVQGAAATATETPMETFGVRWLDTASGGRFEVRTRVKPEAAAAFAQWIPGDTPVGGLDCLDARAGGVAKLSVDGPRMIQAAKAMGGAPPPDLLPVILALEQHWSGELVAWLAGGMLHPVVTIGLRPGADGHALLRAFVDRLATPDVRLVVSDDTVILAIPSPDDPKEETTFRLRYGVTGQSLVLALTPRDVERCVKGEQKPLKLPPELASKGRSGIVISGPIGSVGALPGLLEGPASWRTAEDLLTMAGIAARLVAEVGVAVDMTAQGVAVDFWWEVL